MVLQDTAGISALAACLRTPLVTSVCDWEQVAQLEALLGRRAAVAGSTSNEPLEPQPSTVRAAQQQRPSVGSSLSARRRSSASLGPRYSAEEGSQHLDVQASDRSEHGSSRGQGEEASTAPVRRMLQLSLERSQSVSPQPRDRRSHSLAEWSASAAPLWQPHEQTPSSTTPSTPPAPGQHSGPLKPQPLEQLPSSSQPTSSNSTATALPAAHTSTEASGSGRLFSGDASLPGRPHSPVFRTSTIDVGALMGGSPWRQGGSPRSRLSSPDSPASHASRDLDSSRSIFHTRLRPDSPVYRPDMAHPQNRLGTPLWAEMYKPSICIVRSVLFIIVVAWRMCAVHTVFQFNGRNPSSNPLHCKPASGKFCQCIYILTQRCC